jgi:hypothetical protein
VGGWHYRDVRAVLGLDATWGRTQVAAGGLERRGGRSMAGVGVGRCGWRAEMWRERPMLGAPVGKPWAA